MGTRVKCLTHEADRSLLSSVRLIRGRGYLHSVTVVHGVMLDYRDNNTPSFMQPSGIPGIMTAGKR
jgi:hypothetical protein